MRVLVIGVRQAALLGRDRDRDRVYEHAREQVAQSVEAGLSEDGERVAPGRGRLA